MLTKFTVRAAAWVFVLCTGLFAASLGMRGLEAQAVRGTIQGAVKDPSGGALPGVTVEIKHLGTGLTQSVVTNDEGLFTAPDLPLGDYEVQASLSGFQTVLRRGITLTVGSQRVVDFSLPLGALEETITVESSVPLVDTVSAAVGATIEQKQISDLPLNGRNFAQLISLAPGANQIPFGAAGGNAFFGRQPNFTVAGGRPEGQAFLLDNTNIQGFWNRGPGSGVLGTTLGVEALAEFQTLTNTYSAQFGGAGAVVNAVTKSGTNDLHGSVFEYVRNSKMDARNFFDGSNKPPFSKHQFGGSVGGPLRENKAFFFVTYEGIRQELSETRLATVPDANARNGLIPINGVLTNVGVHPAIQPILNVYPLPTVPLSGGVGQVAQVAKSDGHEDYFLGRFDYTLSDRDSLFARYVRDTAGIFDPFAGANIPLWGADQQTHNQYFTSEHRRVVSASVINQIRFGLVRTREKARTVEGVPELTFFPDRQNGTIAAGSGITTIGAQTTLPVDLEQDRYTAADDVYWNRGKHSLKFGASFEYSRTLMDQPFQAAGVWTFQSLQSFLQNTPQQLAGALPGLDDARRTIREVGLTGYVHDEWRALPRLTLNLGLRYGYMVNPRVEGEDGAYALVGPIESVAFAPVDHVFASNPNLRNFDPRIGVAYDPFDDHRTSIRGGFGIFHNPIGPRIMLPYYVNNLPYAYSRQDFPTFPVAFSSVSAVPLTVGNGLDYESDATPYMMQWNVNVQREIFAATSVTVAYVGSRGVNLLAQRDLNPVTPRTLADGTVVYGVPRGANAAGIAANPRVNPSFSNLTINRPDSLSNYHSLQTSLNRRFSRGLQAQVSYTLSQCRDRSSGSFGGEGSTPATNPYDPAYDYGPCYFDRPHNLRASAVVGLPFRGNKLVEGWQISTIVSATSGRPFTPAVGDQSGLQTANQRPNLAPGRSLDDAITGDINQWFDPTVFTLPAPGTLGNVGRHSLRGPRYANVDMSLLKDVALPSISPGFLLQFRFEVFNVFNRANFGLPSATVFTLTPGGGGVYTATAGRITSADTARQIQLAVKVVF